MALVALLYSRTLGGVKYVQQEWQRSVRALTNSNGFVIARTDHQAFGEDIGVGVGLRKVEQGYSADKATRQGYGLTENDADTGQQHTWFRKLETQAGRWSSPDPYKGSMQLGDPQSFNRYSYVSNQPTNFVDPSGLMFLAACRWVRYAAFTSYNEDGSINSTEPGGWQYECTQLFILWDSPLPVPIFTIPDPNIGGGGGGGTPVQPPTQPTQTCGVNPVTGQSGFSRNPLNATGNLRSDPEGQGQFTGSRRGVPGSHKSLDVAGVLNTTPVVSPFSGTITSSGPSGTVLGTSVTIRHDNGMESQLGHLQARTTIGKGRVGQGQQIGIIGNTGNVSSTMVPHVHWILKSRPGGTRLDPEKVLNNPCP